jgi:hypothetical protein
MPLHLNATLLLPSLPIAGLIAAIAMPGMRTPTGTNTRIPATIFIGAMKLLGLRGIQLAT